MADQIKDMIEKSNRPADKVVFDDDPKRLIEKVIKMVEDDKKAVQESNPHI
jgi:hypothetical protein